MDRSRFAATALPLLIGIGFLAAACSGMSDSRSHDSAAAINYGDSADWDDWNGWGSWGGFYGHHHGLDYDGFDRDR